MAKSVVSLNSTDLKVISLLKTDHYVSGELIAKELGLSRTSVWKTVKKVSKLGIVSDAASGKGYTLSRDIKLLNKIAIESGLNIEAKNLFKINVEGVVGSTNTVLFDAAKQGERLDFNVLVAEQQTHGKGRLGREWITPFAHQLALSCHLKIDTGMSSLYGASIAAGICVIDSMNSIGITELGLKWPNDIYTKDNKKVGGILIEMQQEAEGPIHLVLGIGINCLHSSAFDEVSDVEVSSLESFGKTTDRNILCSEILNSISSLYIDIIKGKPLDSYFAKWNDCNIYQDKKIIIKKNSGEELVGADVGIDNDGALLVDVDGEIQKIFGNLCSIRLKKE